jgi:hypothetical protein
MYLEINEHLYKNIIIGLLIHFQTFFAKYGTAEGQIFVSL